MSARPSHKLAALTASAALGVTAFAVTAPASAAPLADPTAFVVVQGGTGTDKAVAAVKAAGGTVTQEWPQIGVVIAAASDDSFDDKARAMPGILEAGPTRALRAFQPAADVTPDGVVSGLGPGTSGGDDTLEPLNAQQWDMRLIKADQAHRITDGSRDVAVAVVDSGIEADHPDLAANIDPALSVGCANKGIPDSSPTAWQPTTSYHGTHVAGSIAAARNNVGIVGVAPNVRLASIKVVDDDGFIYPEYAICGFVTAADKGVEVANHSYYIDPYALWCKANRDERAAIVAIQRAIKYTEKKDVVNVAAAGNSNWDLSKPIEDTGSPNNLPEGETPEVRMTDQRCYDMPTETSKTVSVSSVGPDAAKAYYSSYGRNVITVAAPGGNARVAADTPSRNGRILSTVLDGKWGYAQGTSMASPHAAGVVALIRSSDPTIKANQAISTLQREADRLSCPVTDPDYTGDGQADATCEGGATGKGFFGAGLIDALDAVQ